MIKRMGLLALATVALGLGAAAVAEDLETVEKKIATEWKKHKSLSAKLTMTHRSEARGAIMSGKGEGTFELQRTGDKVLLRVELKNTMTHKMGEQEQTMEQPMTTIVDGEFAYTVTEVMGQKMAMKSKIDPTMSGDPNALFGDLREKNTLKLLPEETIDGEKVFVIEATPKQKPTTPGVPSKTVIHISQKTGCLVKLTAFTADDKPMMTMAYTDRKIDPKIDPERFKFTAPAGVQVIDQTGSP